jgi:hypothetical protein
VSALPASGRFRVIRQTSPSASVSTVLMARPFAGRLLPSP